MKKIVLSAAIATASLLGSVQSHAASYVITVCEVQSHSNGWAYINPCGSWTSKEGNGNDWVLFDLDAHWARMAYSTVLIAHQTATPIRIGLDPGNTSRPYDVVSYVRILE